MLSLNPNEGLGAREKGPDGVGPRSLLQELRARGDKSEAVRLLRCQRA